MAGASTARVKWLAAPSSNAWLEQAIAQPELVLIDHAHCERKAAGVALQLMFRYQSDEELATALSPLAREELEHFEQVLQVLMNVKLLLRLHLQLLVDHLYVLAYLQDGSIDSNVLRHTLRRLQMLQTSLA